MHGNMDGRQSHIDHIVESQDTVGFHHAIHAVRHPVRPLGHAHGIGRGEGVGAIRLPSLVAGVGHQHEAEFFDSLDEGGHDILSTISKVIDQNTGTIDIPIDLTGRSDP